MISLAAGPLARPPCCSPTKEVTVSEWKRITWRDIMVKEPTGKAREIGDKKPPRMAILDIPGKPRIPLFWRPRRKHDPAPWEDDRTKDRYSWDQVHEKPRGSAR